MKDNVHIISDAEKDLFEIHVKVYRILYQIINSDVFIHCILDGRRSIPDILQRRIFRPERIMHDSMEIVEPFQNT